MNVRIANRVNKNSSTKIEKKERVDNKGDWRKIESKINKNSVKEKRIEIVKIKKDREDHALARKSKNANN
jgi:hypothetical protein